MDVYLVRLNATQDHPGELVGFFFAQTREQLCDMIDECCDIERVEVLELGPGGIYWAETVNFVVPYPEDAAEDASGLPGGATVCEWWSDAVFNTNEGKWKPIAWSNLSKMPEPS